ERQRAPEERLGRRRLPGVLEEHRRVQRRTRELRRERHRPLVGGEGGGGIAQLLEDDPELRIGGAEARVERDRVLERRAGGGLVASLPLHERQVVGIEGSLGRERARLPELGGGG